MLSGIVSGRTSALSKRMDFLHSFFRVLEFQTAALPLIRLILREIQTCV
jgi:hypothetical protein